MGSRRFALSFATIAAMGYLASIAVAEQSPREPFPIRASISSDKLVYSARETVEISLSLRSLASVSAVPYLAFRSSGGTLLFFNSDNGTLTEGDAADPSTWTPYRSAVVELGGGTLLKNVPVYAGSPPGRGPYRAYALLVDRATGHYVSNFAYCEFSVFEHSVVVLDGAIHVGDLYEPYMAGWEMPYPQGVSVSRGFTVPHMPVGDVELVGRIFATFAAINPVILDGRTLGNLPGHFNGNVWFGVSASLHSALFGEGAHRITFTSTRLANGHYDDYMIKDVSLYYNAAGE